MDCVVVAGGVPQPDDAIYTYTQGKPKALLDMGGRTMLERVVDALQAAQAVDDVIVVGLGGDMGMTFQRPVQHLPDQGNLVDNVIAGMRWIKANKPESRVTLASSADIPALTGHVVDHFVELCRPFDHALYYNFVTREAMETRFPTSNRTFIKLRGLEIAGGDIVMVHVELADSHHELWMKLANARKHAWQIARIVGLRLVLKLLLRRVSIADIQEIGQRMIERPVKVILNPNAEIAMDADKPHQVDLLREDLAHHSVITL